MRIAMWSGPRNLSTALMYSFGARADFAVWDEPFYAPYLRATGLDHPMGDAIMATHEDDPEAVAARCLGDIPQGRPHFYMKHMPHHMIDGFPLEWAKTCVNIHLLRHPARVIASYAAKRDTVTADDIGFRQQAMLYDKLGGVVIDSADIRANPEVALRALCDAIGLTWDAAMLSWPAGGRADDGVWASHWYGAIHQSTGFAGPEGPMPTVPEPHEALLQVTQPHFDELYQRRITF